MRNRVTFSYEPKYNYTYGIYEDTIFFSYLDEDIHRDNVRYTYAHDRATADLRSTVSISYTYINPIDHNIEIHDIDVYDRHIYKYVDSTFSGNINVDIKPLFENKLTRSIIVSVPTNSDVYVINSNNLNNANLKKALTDKYGNVHTLIIYVHIVRLDNISHKTIPNEVTTFTDTSFTYANYYIPGYNNEYELGSYYCDDTIYNEEPDVYTDNTYLTTRDKDYIGGMSVKYNLPYQKLMAKVKYENNPYVIKLFNYTNQIIRNSYLYDPENNCFNISFLNAPEVNINLRGMEDKLLITDMESNHIGTTLMKIEFSYRGYHYEKISDVTFSDLVNNVDQLVELEWVVNSDSTPKTRLLEGDILNYTYVNTDPMRANCKVIGYFGYHPFHKELEAETSRINHTMQPLAWEYIEESDTISYYIEQLYDTHSSNIFEHNSYFTISGVTNRTTKHQSISSYIVPVDIKMFVNDIETTEDITYTEYDITDYLNIGSPNGENIYIRSYINPEYYNGLTDASVTYINDNQISNDNLSNMFIDEEQTQITYYIDGVYDSLRLGFGCHKHAVTTYNNDIRYDKIHYVQTVYRCDIYSINNSISPLEDIRDLCRYKITDILYEIKKNLLYTNPNAIRLDDLMNNVSSVSISCNDTNYLISDDFDKIYTHEDDNVWYLYIDKLTKQGINSVIQPRCRLSVVHNNGNKFVFDVNIHIHLGTIDTQLDLYDPNDTIINSSGIISTEFESNQKVFYFDYAKTSGDIYSIKPLSATKYWDYIGATPYYLTDDATVFNSDDSEYSGEKIVMDHHPMDSSWQGYEYKIHSYQYSNYKDLNDYSSNEYAITLLKEKVSSAKASLNNIPSNIYLFAQFGVDGNEYKNPWANYRCSDVHGETQFDTFDIYYDEDETIYDNMGLIHITQEQNINEIKIGLNPSKFNELTTVNDFKSVHMKFKYMGTTKDVYILVINDLKFIIPENPITLHYINMNYSNGDSNYKQCYTFDTNSITIKSNSLSILTNNSICYPYILVEGGKLIFKIFGLSNADNASYKLYNNRTERIYIESSNNIAFSLVDGIFSGIYPVVLSNNDSITFGNPNAENTNFVIRTGSYTINANNNNTIYRLIKEVNVDIDDITDSLYNNNGNIEIYTNGKQ